MMNKIKKRTINEYRQVKEYYTPPVSHKAAKEENRKVEFTKKELSEFLNMAILEIWGLDDHNFNYQGLKSDCKNYTQVYFNS